MRSLITQHPYRRETFSRLVCPQPTVYGSSKEKQTVKTVYGLLLLALAILADGCVTNQG